MKLTRGILLACCGVLFVSGQAEVLSPGAALERALSVGSAAVTRSRGYELLETVATAGGEPAVYLFGDGERSLVVSGDDCSPGLLGWAEVPPRGGRSPEFAWWMRQYADQIEWARRNGVTAPDAAATRGGESRRAIAPMLKTRWNQGAPFNDDCPVIDGKRSVTGCVATAMAQAVNWYRISSKGKGTATLELSDGNKVTFDYGAATFNWSDMADTYGSSSTAAQKKAVANLMLACGVAVQMNYSPTESGASAERIPEALVSHFGYGYSTRNYFRDVCTSGEWDDIVYGQLENVGPVIYSGSNQDAGHCFVCDGYSDGYYHINWGWGGLDDGYFLLSALDPGVMQGTGGSNAGYNYHQVIAADMKAPGSAVQSPVPVVAMLQGFNISEKEIDMSTVKTVTVGSWTVNYSCGPVNLLTGLEIVDRANGDKTYANGAKADNLKVLYGFETYKAALPALPAGAYLAYPCFSTVGALGQGGRIPVPAGTPDHYLLEVSGTKVKISPGPVATVSITGLHQASATSLGQYVRLEGSAENTSSLDFDGSVVLMVTAGGEEIARGERQPLQLGAGEQEAFSYVSPLMGDSIGAGQFDAMIVDAVTGSPLSEGFTLTVGAKEKTEVSAGESLAFAGTAGGSGALKFTATVKCESGSLGAPVQIAIAEPANGQVLMLRDSAPLFLETGESAEVTFTVWMEGAAGGEYLAAVFFANEQVSKAVKFTLASSAVDGVTDGEGREEVYDLTGRKLRGSRGLAKGLYIINGKKVAK